MAPRLHIFHQSIIIQGVSIDVLFNGLLPDLATILDGFFINTTSDYIGVADQGWWGKPMMCS